MHSASIWKHWRSKNNALSDGELVIYGLSDQSQGEAQLTGERIVKWLFYHVGYVFIHSDTLAFNDENVANSKEKAMS